MMDKDNRIYLKGSFTRVYAKYTTPLGLNLLASTLGRFDPAVVFGNMRFHCIGSLVFAKQVPNIGAIGSLSVESYTTRYNFTLPQPFILFLELCDICCAITLLCLAINNGSEVLNQKRFKPNP